MNILMFIFIHASCSTDGNVNLSVCGCTLVNPLSKLHLSAVPVPKKGLDKPFIILVKGENTCLFVHPNSLFGFI